ncbi:MAG: metallophosphoesterase [bacterium]
MAGVMYRFVRNLYGLFNVPYVPEEMLECPRPRVLHISDTPGSVYPFLFRLIDKLRPEYLIHTGDFLDEIKLENRPGQLVEYRPRLMKLLQQLEAQPAGTIYLIPGNHDDLNAVEQSVTRSKILPEKSWIEIEETYFFVSHHYEPAEVGADFFLFGHSLTPDHIRRDKTVILNGIPAIHLISLPAKQVFALPYPSGTDSARQQLLPKIGL